MRVYFLCNARIKGSVRLVILLTNIARVWEIIVLAKTNVNRIQFPTFGGIFYSLDELFGSALQFFILLQIFLEYCGSLFPSSLVNFVGLFWIQSF